MKIFIILILGLLTTLPCPSAAGDNATVSKEVIERSNFYYPTTIGDFTVDYSVTKHSRDGECYDITWWFSASIPGSPSTFEVTYPDADAPDDPTNSCMEMYRLVKSPEGMSCNVLEFVDLTGDGFPDIKLNVRQNPSGISHVWSAIWVYMPATKKYQKVRGIEEQLSNIEIVDPLNGLLCSTTLYRMGTLTNQLYFKIIDGNVVRLMRIESHETWGDEARHMKRSVTVFGDKQKTYNEPEFELGMERE